MSEAMDYIEKLDGERREYLRGYFANAPEGLTDRFQLVRMPAGATFIQEGTPVEKVFILLEGKVSAVDYRVREAVYGFCQFYPIEVFGVMEILGKMDRYKTTLATLEPSVFLKISRELYENWICNDIHALRLEMTRMINYLLKQNRRDRLYILLSGNERIYLALTSLYENYGKGGTYRVYMSRKDLVTMTGLSERTVTRAIRELEDRGCISKEGWTIVITPAQYEKMRALLDTQLNEMEE